MMRPDVKLSAEVQKVYNTRKLIAGLISPFGILFLIFLVYSLAGGETGEQQASVKGQMQQVQRATERR